MDYFCCGKNKGESPTRTKNGPTTETPAAAAATADASETKPRQRQQAELLARWASIDADSLRGMATNNSVTRHHIYRTKRTSVQPNYIKHNNPSSTYQ